MKYQRFEDLPVWRAPTDLAVSVYALTAKANFKGHSDLRDQMERSSVSISNNIAEGFKLALGTPTGRSSKSQI